MTPKEFDAVTKLFTSGSQAFREVNKPQGKTLVEVFAQEDAKNAVQVKSDRKRGKMNKTEAEFSLILEAMKQKDEIAWWGFEAITLRLADRTTYCPDFTTWKAFDEVGLVEFIEIKGFLRDDANVKYKVAKEMFPWAKFSMWQKRKGNWEQIR